MEENKYIPKQALQYRPKERRIIGRPKNRWRDQLHFEDQGTGNTPNPSETWWWWWWQVFHENRSLLTVYAVVEHYKYRNLRYSVTFNAEYFKLLSYPLITVRPGVIKAQNIQSSCSESQKYFGSLYLWRNIPK